VQAGDITICNEFDNYCDDIGAFDSKKRFKLFSRQDVPDGERRAIEILSFGYETPDEVNEAVETLQVAIDEGEVESAVAMNEVTCVDCDNVCHDCEVNGEWYVIRDTQCDQLDDCPSDNEDLEISIRTVLNFSGFDELGANQDLGITQAWNFGEPGFCKGTWGATYRFYSDTTQCRIRTLDIGNCQSECDEGVSEGLREMVCQRDNLLLSEEITNAEFSRTCKILEFQDVGFEEGDGRNINILPFESGAGRLGGVVSLWMLLLVAVVGMLV